MSTISLIIDAFLVLIFVLSIIMGTVRGIFRCFVRVAALIIALALALGLTALFAPVAEREIFYEPIYEKVESIVSNEADRQNISQMIDSLQDKTSSFSQALADFGVDPDAIFESVQSILGDGSDASNEELAIIISEKAASIVSKLCTFTASFALLYLLLFLVAVLLGKLVDASPFKAFDRILGGFWGIIGGYIKVCALVLIIANVIPAIFSLLGYQIQINQIINNSYILKFLLNNNLITALL